MRASVAAAIQPAVPPPTIRMPRIRLSTAMLRKVGFVQGSGLGRAMKGLAHALEIGAYGRDVALIHQGIVALRPYLLTHEHGNPIGRCEQVAAVLDDSPAARELPDLIGQGFRDVHGAAVLPQRRVLARGGLVMKD